MLAPDTEQPKRVVKSTGDGVLADFPSVVDAVRCAVDVQRGMAERNTGRRKSGSNSALASTSATSSLMVATFLVME
jgi:class 3 adenylate cyclase